jgi:hypothetical protein
MPKSFNARTGLGLALMAAAAALGHRLLDQEAELSHDSPPPAQAGALRPARAGTPPRR